MWSTILLMSRLPEGHSCLWAGDRKSSTTNSRQSADRHYQAIGADRTQRSAKSVNDDANERLTNSAARSADDANPCMTRNCIITCVNGKWDHSA